ncbi:hypothetical protein C8J57DRAFT_1233642 [Mycena rebaudengoi]|nr:hypothetical protein C8J57DRAFT_1233642 [Mycena rebaudengoi]
MSYSGDIYIRPPAPCTEFAMHLLEMDKLVWVEAESQREDHNARECSSKFSEGALVLGGKAAAAIEVCRNFEDVYEGHIRGSSSAERRFSRMHGDGMDGENVPPTSIERLLRFVATAVRIRESHSLVTEPMQIGIQEHVTERNFTQPTVQDG